LASTPPARVGRKHCGPRSPRTANRPTSAVRPDTFVEDALAAVTLGASEGNGVGSVGGGDLKGAPRRGRGRPALLGKLLSGPLVFTEEIDG